MSYLARTITDKTHGELKALAGLHSDFNAFMRDVESLAEKMWHNARSQSEPDQSVQPTPAPYGVGGLVPPDPSKAKVDAEQEAIQAGTAARQDPASEGGDAGFTPGSTGEPAEGAQVTPGPTDDGTETKPADPASPVSDVGVSQPVQPSTPVNP